MKQKQQGNKILRKGGSRVEVGLEIIIVIVVNFIISTTITIVFVNALGKILVTQFFQQFESVVNQLVAKL